MVVTSDSAGNKYVGVDDTNLSTLDIARGEIEGELTAIYGTGNFAVRATNTKYHVNWRPNIPEEVLTSAVGAVSSDFPRSNSPTPFTRFAIAYAVNSASSLNYFSAINCNDTNNSANNSIRGATLDALTPGANIVGSMKCWITLNPRYLITYVLNETTGYRYFTWTGVLSDSTAPYNTYPLNCAALVIGNDGVGGIIDSIIRVATPNGNTAQNILSSGDANYPISCSNSATPGSDWATDLFARDDNPTNNNPTAGRFGGLLLAKGGTQVINTTYQVGADIQGVEPGSDLYKCVADFGTDKILMKVSPT